MKSKTSDAAHAGDGLCTHLIVSRIDQDFVKDFV